MADSQQHDAIVQRWRVAGEARDAAAAASCLSADVELVSPLTAQFHFRGRQQVQDVLAAAFAVFDDLHVTAAVSDGPLHALFYRGRLGAQDVEEAQLLQLDDDGLIRRITLFVRPLPGLTALMRALGPELARRQRRPLLAAFLAVATAPLHALTRAGERRVVPLAAPVDPPPAT